jgi:hypothetical protein
MPNPSRARLFFDEVMRNGDQAFSFLASLTGAGESAAEDAWRDYKAAGFIGRTADRNKEKEKIKSTWSENLSAFANTAGGVLIWGIQTKGKIPENLDLAADCEQLSSTLQALINDATDPHVAGVEVRAVRDPNGAKSGLVVCYIPPSAFAPHQAQWGERTYFIRTQDANLPCPQPLLRNMFFPRVQARLEPTVKMTVSERAGNIAIALEARIRSLGPATAEVAMIQVEPRDLHVEKISFDPQWEEIAPNLVRYKYPLPPNFMPPHLIRVNGLLLNNGASILFRFFTHNTPVHHATVTFTQEDALKCLHSKNAVERGVRSDPIYP